MPECDAWQFGLVSVSMPCLWPIGTKAQLYSSYVSFLRSSCDSFDA